MFKYKNTHIFTVTGKSDTRKKKKKEEEEEEKKQQQKLLFS